MVTSRQLLRGARKKIKVKAKYPAMRGKPQIEGVCVKVSKDKTPKKPNSALRAEAKVRVIKTGQIIRAYIGGEGGLCKEHARVLVRPGGAQDIPGQKYCVIGGAAKRDCPPAGGHPKVPRKKKRSKYGVKKPTVGAKKK